MKEKQREIILYIVFGGLPTLVGIGSFAFLYNLLDWNEHVANLISWILSVLFAYGTNRVFVFESKEKGGRNILKEATRFLSSRLTTLILEEALLFLFITRLNFPGLPVKIFAQALVILLNYILSRRIVFRL